MDETKEIHEEGASLISTKVKLKLDSEVLECNIIAIRSTRYGRDTREINEKDKGR